MAWIRGNSGKKNTAVLDVPPVNGRKHPIAERPVTDDNQIPETSDPEASDPVMEQDPAGVGLEVTPDQAKQPDEEAGEGENGQNIDEWFMTLRRNLHQQIISKLNPGVIRSMKEDDLKKEVRRQVE